jgi:hypothetical protein
VRNGRDTFDTVHEGRGPDSMVVDDAQLDDTGDQQVRVSPTWVVLYLLLAFGAGVAVSYGLARDDTLWLVIGAGVFAPLVVIGAHAAAGLESSPRAAALGTVCALTLVAVVAVVVSTPWWGDDAASRGAAFVLAADDPSAHVYLRDRPEGKELTGGKHDPAPLVSRHEYQFSCGVELGDSTRWLRLEESKLWAPASVLRPVGKTAADQLPRC